MLAITAHARRVTSRQSLRPDINWRIAIQCAMLYRDDVQSSARLLMGLPTVLGSIVLGYVPDRHTPRELELRASADWTNILMDAPRDILASILSYCPVSGLAMIEARRRFSLSDSMILHLHPLIPMWSRSRMDQVLARVNRSASRPMYADNQRRVIATIYPG